MGAYATVFLELASVCIIITCVRLIKSEMLRSLRDRVFHCHLDGIFGADSVLVLSELNFE